MKQSIFDVPAAVGANPPQQQQPQQPQQPAVQPLNGMGVAQMGAMMPDPYEIAKPTHLSLMNSAAKQAKDKGQLEMSMAAAYQGLTPMQQYLMRQQEEVAAKTEEVLAKTSDVDDSTFQKILGKMDNLASEMRNRKAPTMKAPTYDWGSSMATALAMLVDPEGAGTYASQYGAAMQGRTKDVFEMEESEFKAESEAMELEYNLTQEQLRRQQEQDEMKRRQIEAAITRELRVLQQQGVSIEKQMQFVGDQVAKAQGRYNAANTPEEKRIAAIALESLGVPMDKASVDADINALRARNSQSARNAWSSAIRGYANIYGEVPESIVPQLEAQKAEIAGMLGVDESAFDPIPTEKTIRAQIFERSKEQFDKTFKLRDDTFKQRVAEFDMNYALAKRRIEIAERNSATSAGHLEIRGKEFEYKKALDAAEGTFDITAKEIGKAEKELAIAEAEVDQFKKKGIKLPWMTGTNDDIIVKGQQKVQMLKSELAALKALRDEAERNAQAIDEALGAGNEPPQVGANPGALLPPIGGPEIPLKGGMAAIPNKGGGKPAKAPPRATPPKTQPKASGTLPGGRKWSVQ